ncbi:hypothetical protein AGMMS49957_12910 [Synergistales bacterium]|nr:hypothetical protein AGMMS49957_12910 [Synergistales bacterium]
MSNIDIKNPAPIAFFVYKRPIHTKRVIEALAANDLASESDLFIFSDAPMDDNAREDVLAVRELIRNIKGFRSVTITERETNYGIAKNIIDGVTEICDRFGRVVIVEDDILTLSSFLRFINEGLEKYKDNEKVFAVNGFWPLKPQPGDDKALFLKHWGCLGWGTWKRAWDFFDYDVSDAAEKLLNDEVLAWDFSMQGRTNGTDMLLRQFRGKLKDWGNQWWWAIFSQNGISLYPPHSLTDHIGFDSTAWHADESAKWMCQNVDLSFDAPITLPDSFEIDEQKQEEYADFYYWGSCPA